QSKNPQHPLTTSLSQQHIPQLIPPSTPIPLTTINQTQSHPLLNLQHTLHHRLIPQKHPLTSISKPVTPATPRLKHPK
uniref:hypothetical protein n=1 Tax=Staphylococcus pasteuri TaxID=45972 RepID=UPI001C9A2358